MFLVGMADRSQLSTRPLACTRTIYNRIRSVPLALASLLQDPTAGGRRCRWQFPGGRSKSASNHQSKVSCDIRSIVKPRDFGSGVERTANDADGCALRLLWSESAPRRYGFLKGGAVIGNSAVIQRRRPARVYINLFAGHGLFKLRERIRRDAA